MTRLRLTALAMLVLALPIPARAQAARKGAAEYYIILDTRTRKCTVVDKAPQVDSHAITLASDAIYSTRTEAEAAIKALKPCLAS